MKRFLSVALLLVLTLTLLLTGCRGQKEVESIQLEGLQREYELNEKADFSGVTATIVYNDGTTKSVVSSDLTFGSLDTSIAGKKDLAVTYEDFTAYYEVTVKPAKTDIGSRTVESIKYMSGLPEVVYVNDTLNFDNIKIIVNYVSDTGEKTQETVTLGENGNATHNGSEINTAKLGEQVLTISFMGKTVDVIINVLENNVIDLTVDASSVDTSIYENQEFDPTGMVVTAIYNNGQRLNIAIDKLEIVRDGNKVTISYGGKSAELTLSYDVPFVTEINVNVGSQSKIVYGDSFNYDLVSVSAKMSNGTTRDLGKDEVTLSIDVSKVGTAKLSCTYNEKPEITATADVTVLGIENVNINTKYTPPQVKLNETINLSDLVLIITCSDGTVVERNVAQGVVVTLDEDNQLDTTKTGTYYVTASYGGVSSTMSIVVYEETNYIIVSASLPTHLTGWLTKKEKHFLDSTGAYVVGDDNPFILKLTIEAEDINGNIIDPAPISYTGFSEVYLNGVLLTGDELLRYVEIDDTRNSFDFTEEAIGKEFTIKTRPRFIEGDQSMKEWTVQVVDGFNIHEAWELNYLVNYSDTTRFNQRELAQTLINQKGGVAIPDGVAGFIIHNDLHISTSDVPAAYFVGNDPANGIWDYITIFPHTNDNADKNFTFHGNFFTIYSYGLPNVCSKDISAGNQDDAVSNSQLFRFTNNNASGGDYDHTQYNTTIKNLYLRDDNPSIGEIQVEENWTPEQIEAYEKMIGARKNLGLIAMKVSYQNVEIVNIRVEAFYISFFADHDYLTVNIRNSKFFNAWQNHMFIFSDNTLQSSTETPRENYHAATVNIYDSELTKCGGPVIITQSHTEDQHSKCGAQVSLDDNTEIWTYVTGTEPWFKAMGAEAIVPQFTQLGYAFILPQTEGGFGLPKTIISITDETGNANPNGYMYLNMIMVNLPAGTSFEAVAGSSSDLDGKFTVGDKAYLDMNDGENGSYGDANVSAQVTNGILTNLATGGTVISTHSGGMISLTNMNGLAGMNPQGITDGDYITVYKGNLGIVFEYGAIDRDTNKSAD